MKQIFGILFFIILICLIYLHYQGKISGNIPIIFMFFLIIIIPFIYLENNNKNIESFSSYDQIMNSSLDIFYTNQNNKKREMNKLKKIPLLYNPLKASIIKKDIKQFELYLYSVANQYNIFYVIYNNYWNNIFTKYGSNENIFTYLVEDDFKKSSFKSLISTRIQNFGNLQDLKNNIEKAPAASYIIISANNIAPIKNSSAELKETFITQYKFSNWINTNTSDVGSLIVILAKSYNNSYTILNEKSKSTNDSLSIYQTIKIDPIQVETNGGDVLPNVRTNDIIKSIDSDPLINSKINIISPATLNPDYSLSITVENNESFVYLSSNKLDDEVVLYSKSPKSDIGPTSTTKLDTQTPQFWSFEAVTKVVTNPLIVFIRTYTKPYFYLDAEYENGVMVLKAKRFKAGLRQQWELMINSQDKTKYNIRHLKSAMYLAYSDFDGYLYKNDGSVFLSKSNQYLWNIKQILENNIQKVLIENFEPNKINAFIDTEVPTDFSTVENPSWKISGNVRGQNIVIESKGRTLWKSNYSPIWSGRWIYHGTVESYKATLNINTVKFLIIKMDANGTGKMIDDYFNFNMNLTNVGSNILTGIIPSGKYKDYRAILKLIPTNLKYNDPSKTYPIKMRYFIQKDSTILNLSSSDINNMQSYSTKFLGDTLILSNFLEASGIQTDANLGYSSKNLENINKNVKDQIAISDILKVANKFMSNKIKKSKLIYKASKNGWNASTFHNLCDNKGPTITIATLQDGRFIGAYSPVNWGKANYVYINNKNSFLFDNEQKYTIDEFNLYAYAIYQNPNYGPTFGAGHDFLTLIPWSQQTLSTYSYMYLNNNKGPLGVNRYSNNIYQLRDLEVFSITIQNNPENEWQMTPGLNSPMKLDEISGDPQCLSYDSTNCAWDYKSRFGDNLSYIDKNRVNPLTCGDDHRKKWGNDGYYEGHWCNNLREYFNKKVIVYEHANYQGRRLELGIGTYDYNFINSKGFNDVISSIKVPKGLEVEAWEHNPGEGRKWVFTSNTNWVGNANDTISSLIVKPFEHKPKIMYGPWISREQKTQIRNLNNGEVVHIIFDHIYTKMVSSDGQEKYYQGSIDQFNPNNWNSYNNTGGGKYLLR